MDNCVPTQENIDNVLNEVSHASFKARQNFKNEEDIMNEFLDAINDVKKSLDNRSKTLESITDMLIEITWCIEPSVEILKKINNIIVLANDYHNTLRSVFSTYITPIENKSVATKEIFRYKNAIDNFKESTTDLEDTFFILPFDEEFKEITKQLLSAG
jgi:uncharacterized phage infection (PIP) family protein YhgE